MKKFLIWYGYFILAIIIFSLLASMGAQSLLLLGFALGWFANERFTIKKKAKRKKRKV